MKKHFRTLCTLLVAFVCSLCLAVGFTACKTTHKHSWSEDWSSNATHHWHAPECDDTDELKDKAEHVDKDEDGKCDTCDYEVGHEHTWDDVWHGNAEGHWHNATCTHTGATSAIEPHVDENDDEECDLCGEYTAHVHRFEEAYQSNAEGHWHNASCSHKEETSEVEPHVDADDDGFCDACNFAVGHEHRWSDEWEYNDEGHWHRAICAHNDLTTTPEPHHVGELGDCAECDYHEHVIDDTKYAVDEWGHWHAALCGHEEAEAPSYEMHNYVEGKCETCGVEQAESAIYNDYYLLYAKFFEEEELSFTAWHAALVEDGVKHVEINSIGDVVYTYAGEGDQDVTEIVYLTKRSFNISLVRGQSMAADVSFPVINYNIVATTTGDKGTQTVVVGTASTSITGEGTAQFIPYYGITSSNVTYKLEVAEINGAFQITEPAKDISVVAENTSAATIVYNVIVALGVGESNKLASVTFGGASQENVMKSFGLAAPAGWYWLTYDWQTGDKAVTANMLSARIDNGSWYDMYTTRDGKKYEALIYVPDGAKQITFKNYYHNDLTFTDGRSVTLTPYEAEINEINKTFYVATHKSKATTFPLNITPGEYIITVASVGRGNLSSVQIGDKAVTLSSGKGNVTIGEDDKTISIIATMTGTYVGDCSVASVNFSNFKTIELNKAEEITFSADNAGGVFYTFTAPKSGTYNIGFGALGNGAVLTGVRAGKAITATGLFLGPSSSVGTCTAFEMEEGEVLKFNVNYNNSKDYPTVSVMVFNIDIGTIEKDKAEEITFTAGNMFGVFYEFTAPESQYYSIQLTATAGYNLTNVRVGKDLTLTGIVEAKADSTTHTGEMFYLEKGAKLTLNVNYGATANFPKISVKIIDGTLGEVKAETESSINFTSSEKDFYRSFTADKEGYYVISGNFMYEGSITADNSGYFMYVTVGKVAKYGDTPEDYIISKGSSNRWSASGALYLKASETVILCFSYSRTLTFGEFVFEINYVEPTALVADTAMDIALGMENSYKLVSFTAEHSGVHAFELLLGNNTEATTLTGVYVLNLGTGEYVVAQVPAGTSTSSLAFITLQEGNKVNLLIGYVATKANAIDPAISVKFSSPVQPTNLTVNTAHELVNNKNKLYEFFTFTAPESGDYDFVITSADAKGFPYVKVDNMTSGENVLLNTTSAYIKRSAVLTLEKDVPVTLVFLYNNTSDNEYRGYVSINFATQDRTTVLTANNSSTFKLTASVPVKYFKFTAPAEGTYRLFLTSASGLKNIYAYRDGKTSTDFTVPTAVTFYTKTLSLEKDQAVTYKIWYTDGTSEWEDAEIYLSINLPSEEVTAKLTVNTTVDMSFDIATNHVKYYSFTAPAEATYKLIATSEKSIAYLRVYRSVDGTNTSLIYQTSAVQYYDYDIKLAQNEVLLLEMYYQPASSATRENPFSVSFSVNYKEDKTLAFDTADSVTFSKGNQYVSYKFTAPKSQYYVIELAAAESNVLTNVTANNGSTTYVTAAANSTSAQSDLIWLDEGALLSFVVKYGSAADYPEITVKVVAGTIDAVQLGTEDKVTFTSSVKIFYRQFTAEKEGTYVFASISYVSTNNPSNATYSATALRYTYVGKNGKTNNVIAGSTANRYSSAGTFYLKAGETIYLILSFNYNSANYYGTYTFKIVLEEPTVLTSGNAAEVALTAEKLYGAVSYTATVSGKHTLDLALGTNSSATALTNVMVYNALTGEVLIAKATLSGKATYSLTFDLEKDKTIVLVFVFEASTAISATTKLPTVSAKITSPEPEVTDPSPEIENVVIGKSEEVEAGD